MWMPGVKERAMIARGPGLFCERGGNGRVSPAEERFHEMFPRIKWNHAIGVKNCRALEAPRSYKVDFAIPKRKLAIEIDGASHRSLAVQDRDRKKERILGSLGWKILRIPNEVVMEDPDRTKAMVTTFTA
jgi:very-short-patch-repair endonuclease